MIDQLHLRERDGSTYTDKNAQIFQDGSPSLTLTLCLENELLFVKLPRQHSNNLRSLQIRNYQLKQLVEPLIIQLSLA